MREVDQVVAEARRGGNEHPFEAEFDGCCCQCLAHGVVHVVEEIILGQAEVRFKQVECLGEWSAGGCDYR